MINVTIPNDIHALLKKNQGRKRFSEQCCGYRLDYQKGGRSENINGKNKESRREKSEPSFMEIHD
jgi:hypothetical protein